MGVHIHTDSLPTVEVVRDGVLYSAKVTGLPPENLYVNPDCGLRTRRPEIAQKMLDLVVGGAELARLKSGLIPRVTTIGSYRHSLRPRTWSTTTPYRGTAWEEVVDPYLWSMEEALKDFTSAGVDVPSTGQSRGDLYSPFLEPKFVKGIAWQGADAYVNGKIERSGSIRVADSSSTRGACCPRTTS